MQVNQLSKHSAEFIFVILPNVANFAEFIMSIQENVTKNEYLTQKFLITKICFNNIAQASI